MEPFFEYEDVKDLTDEDLEAEWSELPSRLKAVAAKLAPSKERIERLYSTFVQLKKYHEALSVAGPLSDAQRRAISNAKAGLDNEDYEASNHIDQIHAENEPYYDSQDDLYRRRRQLVLEASRRAIDLDSDDSEEFSAESEWARVSPRYEWIRSKFAEVDALKGDGSPKLDRATLRTVCEALDKEKCFQWPEKWDVKSWKEAHKLCFDLLKSYLGSAFERPRTL